MSILDHAPYELRPYQKEALLEIERVWSAADVIMLDAPVGAGKSVLAMTISNWVAFNGKTTAITTPRVALQEQYLRDWPDLPTLKGMSHYHCPTWDISCASVAEMTDSKCDGCVYTACRSRSLAAPIALFNVHSYIFLYNSKHMRAKPKDVLIIDEAHTTFDILAEQFELRLWKHKENYPDKMNNVGDIYAFLETQSKKFPAEIALLAQGDADDKKEADKLKKKAEKFYRVMEGLKRAPTNFFIQKDKELYKGKKYEEVLKIRPLDLNHMPEILWMPRQKVVMMTGTLHDQDIQMLGLKNRRVVRVTVDNPIPAERRPVIITQGLNMGKDFQDKNLKAMAALIEGLAVRHKTKGVVHLTYGLADKLSAYLTDPKYIFHTSENREEKLQQFLDDEGDSVLMACGMTTGLDLVGPNYSWQAIAKIPYPSLGDPLVAKWLRENPEWYQWLSVRQVLQATGRICRGPLDYGATYILDNSAGTMNGKRYGLLSKASKMIPQYFKEAVKYE
jgi:Rad3-related DNA helicase